MSTHPIRSFWSASRSKSWPGCSRFAIGVLIFCLLIAVAQLVVSSFLDVNVLNVEPSFQCLAKGGKFVDSLPTTFFSKGPSKTAPWVYFSILGHDKKAYVFKRPFTSSPLMGTGLTSFHIVKWSSTASSPPASSCSSSSHSSSCTSAASRTAWPWAALLVSSFSSYY